MISIVEDFVPKIFQDQLEAQLLSPEFLWSYSPYTTNPSRSAIFVDKDCSDTPQFVHGFFGDNTAYSNYYTLIHPFLYFMSMHNYKVASFWRSKSNMTLPVNVPKEAHSYPHTDLNQAGVKGISMLYYVNDSDGDTIFFEESPEEFNGTLTVKQRVTPKKGTAVIFDSATIHAGQVPKNAKNRVVVSSIFLVN